MKCLPVDPVTRISNVVRRRGRPGFALIVTLSLMILLTVIAVGLLMLSSISLRSTNATSAMAEARQNARMALMLAIGELQKYGGQDQRSTAVADIAGSSDGSALAGGVSPQNNASLQGGSVTKGLSSVKSGTRYWTGIFVNQDNPDTIYTKSPTPLNIHWLVSGNNSSYSATTPKGGPSILPSDSKYAVGASGSVSDATQAVILAGKNSVGSGPGSDDRYVVAPLVGITDTTNKLKGRYAWWVGDEGVKAKLNIPRTLKEPTLYASLSAQRRGWETVTGFESYPQPAMGNAGMIPNVISVSEAALLVPSANAAVSGATPLQTVFHSATADSRGVLTDSLNGGTRIDLSAILAGNLPASSPVPSIKNYPVAGKTSPVTAGNIIQSSLTTTMKAPKWDAVKEFNDRRSKLTGGSLIVTPATSNITASIAPLITDIRVLLGAKLRVKDARAGMYDINACGKIAVAIANPYSVPLKWTRGLDFEVIGQTPSGNNPSQIWNLGAKAAYFASPSNNRPAVFNGAIFRIDASTLAPGEARAYTFATSVLRPATAGSIVVNLVPFSSADPSNFDNCIELQTTSSTDCSNGTPSLDVRESWQTTLNRVEMRVAGAGLGSSVLRSVERFEFDDGYFSATARNVTKDDVPRMTKPFGIMLYNFQISQPGMDYKADFMPSNYSWGQRGSTLRTFADFNLQATRYRKPIASYNPPPFFMESNDSRALLPQTVPGGDTGIRFTRNLVLSPMPWGRSSFGSKNTILFSVPEQLSSLAQLQHADLTGDDVTSSIAHQPGNAFGNSYAPPFVKRSLTKQSRTDYEIVGAPNHTATNNTSTNYYDISYLLNASVWDTYFMSTIPASGVPEPVVPTFIKLDSAATSTLRDPVEVATQLMVDGAFNVNSTDKNAWKAFLASAKHLEHPAGPSSATNAAFPRSLEQTSPSATVPTGTDADSFSGYRRLTDAQLDALAGEIVKQVRLRGPFVSLSQFVNRALAPITTQSTLSRSGALQCAIDESGININIAGDKNGFSGIKPDGSNVVPPDRVTLGWLQGAPSPDMLGGDTGERPADADSSHPDWAKTSKDNNFGSVASILADQEMLTSSGYIPEQGYRSTGIPGWLTQADVLQVIGNSLTVRSDTFRIRAYGESLDASGNPVAKAHCEAIIQRFPKYIDPADAPSVRGGSLKTLNQTYGRKFEIISFRWLSPNEV